MATIDERIDEAKRKLEYYFRKRQRNIDNKEKFNYYHERCVRREEQVVMLEYKKYKDDKKES